jgi:hypothetical protein
MTVYVDELQTYAGKGRLNGQWCHMMTDGDLAELHAIAEKIGMRKYFQHNPNHPHYDLRPSKRAAAIKAGAVPVSAIEMVNKCSILLRRIREKNTEESEAR